MMMNRDSRIDGFPATSRQNVNKQNVNIRYLLRMLEASVYENVWEG